MRHNISWGVLLCCTIVLISAGFSHAQTELFNGKLRVKGLLDEYIVFREHKHHDSQQHDYGQALVLWRHRAQVELLFRLYEKSDTIINFYTWLQYYYESGPDVNRKLRKAMSSGQRYRDYQAPFWDSDDMLNECYLDINTGPWTIRLGKQKVIWGEMELQRTTDVVNPLDLRYSSPGIDDLDELKIGIWMARVLYQSSLPGDLIFEFIFNPGDYKMIRLGIQGSDRGSPSVPNQELGGLGVTGAIKEMYDKSEPAFALNNCEVGFRLRGMYNTKLFGEHFEFLWTLQYFNALNDSMIVDDVEAYSDWAAEFAIARGDGVIRPLPRKDIYDAKRFEMFGLGIQTFDPILTEAVIISEFAYFRGLDFNKTDNRGLTRSGKIERDFFTYGLSIRRALKARFFKKLDHSAQGYVDTDLSIFQGWYIGNVSRVYQTFAYGQRSSTTFTLMFRTHFRNQTYTPVLRLLYTTRNTGYVSLSCTVSLSTHWLFVVGYTQTYGNDPTQDGYAAARDKTRTYVKIKFRF